VKESYCKARPPLERGGVVIDQVPVSGEVKDCVGGYHLITSGSHYQGVGEYYDTNGNLIAAYKFYDVVGADCNGAGASKTFGKIPTCSTELVRIDFCKQ
jgi:hypothetical protein